MVQLSHPYLTNGKTITLMIWTSVHKVISVIFNTLSRFVIAFLFYYLFIFNWWFLYNIGLMSDLHQHELTISVQISPLSWISLPPPAHSHCSRLLQSSSFNFLSHTANCHWLLCTYVGVYASMLLCHSSHPLPLLPNPCPYACSLCLRFHRYSANRLVMKPFPPIFLFSTLPGSLVVQPAETTEWALLWGHRVCVQILALISIICLTLTKIFNLKLICKRSKQCLTN